MPRDAGEQVYNFAQIKVGDVVSVAAERSLTFTVSPHGTKLPDASMAQGAARSKPGEKPPGIAARFETLSATIVAVDPAANTIDVVDQHGGLIHTLHVRNPERQASLPMVHPGDLLTVTYTETVGISVDPATDRKPERPRPLMIWIGKGPGLFLLQISDRPTELADHRPQPRTVANIA